MSVSCSEVTGNSTIDSTIKKLAFNSSLKQKKKDSSLKQKKKIAIKKLRLLKFLK